MDESFDINKKRPGPWDILEKITFVIPSRNNLEFLKLSYKSIKNLEGDHEVLVLNDASTDGTQEWLDSLDDDNLHVYINDGYERVGIVGMFDKGIEMASTDIILAFHADMVAGANLDKNILKHLKPGTVVSATRVEPPLHPEGPEKIIENFGLESEEFSFDKWYAADLETPDRTTNGIFAPWCMYKKDYLAIGGHDELFAPQSREDSDLFNRFVLKGYNLIQSWGGIVYHFTSRGSRFNKHSGGGTGKDSPEWQETNTKNMRNFIRKWGTVVQHDEMMYPIITPKYDIGFVVDNCDTATLKELEPWCSDIYGDWVGHKGYGVNKYIEEEQPNTQFDLKKKIHSYHIEASNDVIVEFDCTKLTPQNFQVIVNLSDILKDSGEIGEMEYDIFKITINKLKTYEKDLIEINKIRGMV